MLRKPYKFLFKMKSKLLIISFLMILGVASCKRQQCPAYGKVAPKNAVEKTNA